MTSPFRILITDNLSPAGLDALKGIDGVEADVRSGLTPEEVKAALGEADGIIVRSGTKLTPEVLAGQERLKVVVRAGVGVDNIDLPAATRGGIVVMNTPAGNTTSTAEHTIAMMMALSRNIAPAAASMNAGRWDRKKFTGTQLAGKTLAVIGLGRIGLSVASRAQALEMRVVGFDPFMTEQRAAELGIELYKTVDEIVPLCDYITVHTPLTDETRDLINAERLSKMKKGVRLVNCARGGIINEDALADAVESGHVGGAALDVFVTEPPEGSRLVDLPGVLLTPHLGASTEEAQELVAVEAAELISGFLLRNEIRCAVNMAPISATEMADVRHYLDLSYRLGLLLSQQLDNHPVTGARLVYRGEVAGKKTKLLTSAFTAGLLENALDDSVNIVNAQSVATDRGIAIEESTSAEPENFASMIAATVTTASGEHHAAGTLFGKQFLRLVKLDGFNLEAYLVLLLLIFRHRDTPGLVGYIGTKMGEHGVNIGNMALGRSGEDSVAILNLDSEPSADAMAEI
ncbi:MAG: phosphoglycerate dehydrogenase, partial [Planctomycetaceae bacterium]